MKNLMIVIVASFFSFGGVSTGKEIQKPVSAEKFRGDGSIT